MNQSLTSINYDDITIAFSSYNTFQYLAFAIQTFLKLYPDLRDNIIVFDDGSEDKTVAACELNNIRIHKIQFSKKYQKLIDSDPTNLSLRVNIITKYMMEKIDTQYVYICDNDLVFIYPFLHLFEDMVVKEKYNILGYVSSCEPPNQNIKKIWQGNLFINLDYLKTNKILYDDLSDDMYNAKLNDSLDSGCDFYDKIMLHKHKFFDLNMLPAFTYHFGYRGCISRIKDINWNHGDSIKKSYEIINVNEIRYHTTLIKLMEEFKFNE